MTARSRENHEERERGQHMAEEVVREIERSVEGKQIDKEICVK